MNISLPDALKDFVDSQVENEGYGTSSEYVRELIRRERDRVQLRTLILQGLQTPVAGAADERWIESLRKQAVRKRRS